MEFSNKESLINYIDKGNNVDYVFFWGPGDGSPQITSACLCQWYESPFFLDGHEYLTAEHYMMAEKASLFGDSAMRKRIIAAPGPADAQMLGRHVKNYDETIWQQHRFQIVVTGNLAKFAQHESLKRYLLDTHDKILVDANPIDTVWGVGMSNDNPDITRPICWKGLNLLGFALMKARCMLRT